MPKNAPLIGSLQACKVFGVDRATFNRWVAAGRIPVAHQMDGETGARLFDADVIDQLAAQFAQEKTPSPFEESA
jgi:predicted site-specific integrase-resolvase